MNDIIKEGAAAIVKLTSENSVFSIKNGFVTIKYNDEDAKRVFLHRTFPFEMPWQYISVVDPDNKEIGIIYDLHDFDDKTVKLLKTELERRYYEPHIKSILSLKERYGFSYWTILTKEDRTIDFTMQDTFRHIIRVGEDKAVLLDVNGNRFVIDSIMSLDKKSHKKIEIYL